MYYVRDSKGEIADVKGIGYLAHPYGGRKSNVRDARITHRLLMERFPKLVILNAIDNAAALGSCRTPAGRLESQSDTEILEADFKLLQASDFLILSGDFERSPGCRAEWGFAKARDIPILFASWRFINQKKTRIQVKLETEISGEE